MADVDGCDTSNAGEVEGVCCEDEGGNRCATWSGLKSRYTRIVANCRRMVYSQPSFISFIGNVVTFFEPCRIMFFFNGESDIGLVYI